MADATITSDEVQKIEASIKAKELEAEQTKKREIEKLLDEAVAKGKDEALKTFQAEQERERELAERKKMEDRLKALEAENARIQETAAAKLTELSKQMEEIAARPKGVSKNESPFAPAAPPNPIHGLDPEKANEIERNSMEAWYAAQGRPAPQ